MLGEEDIIKGKIDKGNKYNHKVISKSIDYLNKDKTRGHV
jgi:hypothetical protein